MGKKVTWIVLFLLIISSVSAIAFDVTLSPESQTITSSGKAEFALTVEHEAQQTQYFEIYSSDVQWDLSTIPSTDRVLEVQPRGNKTTKLVLRPLYAETGAYVVDVTVKLSGTNDFIRKSIQIGVARDVDEYSPSVFTKIDMPDEVDPREEVPVKLILENQNRRWIQTLDVKLRSKLINKDYTTSLKPLEKKEIDFKIQLDDETIPQEDTLKVTLFAHSRNKTTRFDVPGKSYKVIGFGDVEGDVEVDRSFLATKRKVTFENTGNALQKKSFRLPSSIFSKLFTNSDHPFYTTKTSEGRFLVWEVVLNSAETKTVNISTNYRPLFFIIVLLILSAIGYVVFRSPLVVKKAAMVVETREGGISELKVIVSMKNRTNYPLRNLVVFDKVPKIAEVRSDFELGTLRPTKIISAGAKGTLIKWNIDSLDPKEERILSYKIKTKLSILGGFRLPPTKISYKFFNYSRTTYSNMEALFDSR